MATITSTGPQGLSGMLKERYVGALNNTILGYSELLDLIQESKLTAQEGSDGLYYKMANLYGGMQGIGSRLENYPLPEGGNPMTINPIVYQKYHYARVDATWQAIKKAENGPAGFADFATGVLRPALQNLTFDLDRQVCGYASGILARVDMVSPSTSLDIDAPFGLASNEKGWLNFSPGMTVVFSPNPDGSGLRSGGQVSTVLDVNRDGNANGGTLSLDSILGDVADNDYIFRGDGSGTNIPVAGTEVELMGLEGMVDNATVVSTLQGIDRNTVYDYRSHVIDGSASPYSASFTEGLMVRAITDAKLYGRGKVDVMVTSNDSWRQAYNSIRQLGGFGARRDGDTVVAGAKGVSIDTPYGTIQLRGVARCAVGRAYALTTSTLMKFTLGGQGTWQDWGNGSMWIPAHVGNTVRDAAYTYYRYPLQLGIVDPKQCVKITGIDEYAY